VHLCGVPDKRLLHLRLSGTYLLSPVASVTYRHWGRERRNLVNRFPETFASSCTSAGLPHSDSTTFRSTFIYLIRTSVPTGLGSLLQRTRSCFTAETTIRATSSNIGQYRRSGRYRFQPHYDLLCRFTDDPRCEDR